MLSDGPVLLLRLGPTDMAIRQAQESSLRQSFEPRKSDEKPGFVQSFSKSSRHDAECSKRPGRVLISGAMGKFFCDDAARCLLCGGGLRATDIARNEKHLYPIGTLFSCPCGKAEVWTNSIRDEVALAAFIAGESRRYYQGFCCDLFDGKGNVVHPIRSAEWEGEEQRGQVLGSEQPNGRVREFAIAWRSRFLPEGEDATEALIAWYEKNLGAVKALTESGEEVATLKNPGRTFIPPAKVAAEARYGLELRAAQPPSNRCCTDVGIRRAVQLANRQPVSVETLKRMRSYFQRHAVDKRGRGWGVSSKGFQAWLLWGGNSGRDFANRILDELGE